MSASTPDNLGSRGVLVYGAGTFGQSLVASLRAVGVEVPRILDRLPRPVADGTPVSHPESSEVDRTLPVALGLCNPHVDPGPVAARLLALGHERVLSPVEVFRQLGQLGLSRSHYWLTSDSELYDTAGAQIAAARGLLSDDKSRAVFDGVLRYRTTGDVTVLPTPDPLIEQYLPRGLPFVTGAVRLVDCGAYDGDTIRAYIGAGVDLQAVVALEPDPVNFRSLLAELDNSSGVEVLALPLGVGDDVRTLNFAADGTSGSAVTSDGSRTIQCVSLDSILHGWRPTHVKMDIEGSESDALHGMARSMAHDRPALAISLYHRPADLWELVHQVNGMMSPAAMHIRVYGHQGFDTVLYAMP